MNPVIKSATLPIFLCTFILGTCSISFGQRPGSNKSFAQLDKEIEDQTKAIELNPNDEKLYIKRGRSLYRRFEKDKALDDFNKAVEIAPHSAYVYLERGGFYSLYNKNELAIADYTKSIDLAPHNLEAFIERGFAYKRTKKYQMAIADFSKTIDLEPKNRLHYINRAEMYENSGNFKNALNDYSSAIVLDTSVDLRRSHAIYYRRGLIKIKLNESKAAIEDFNRAIKYDPEKNYIYFKRRADSFCKIGEKEKAGLDEKVVIDLGGKITTPCR